MVTLNKKKIIESIYLNFKDNMYPKKDFYNTIAERDYLEIDEVNPKRKVRKWEDISKDTLLKYYDFLLFLDDEGVKYYLPSYVITLLKHEDTVDTWIYDTLMQTIPTIKFSIYTEEQKNVLLNFLIYLKQNCSECDVDLLEKSIESI